MQIIDYNIISKKKFLAKLEENNNFYSAVFWGTIGGIFSQGINYIVLILISRLLGATELGKFTLFQSTINAFSIFTIFGLTITATKIVSEYKNKTKILAEKAIGNIYFIAIITSLSIGLIFLLFSQILSENIFNSPQYNIFFLIGTIWLISLTFDSITNGILTGLEAFRSIVKVNMIRGVLSIFILYPLAYKYGLLGCIIGQSINFTTNFIVSVFLLKKELLKYDIKINLNANANILKEILKFSFPVLLASILTSPTIWLSNLIIANKENGLKFVGLYSVAFQWSILIQFLPSQISRVTLPVLSNSDLSNTKNKQIVKSGLIINLSTIILLAVLSIIFRDFIIHLYNFNSKELNLILIIVIISSVFSVLNNYLGQVIVSRGKIWTRTISDFVISLTMISVTFVSSFYIPQFSLPIALLLSSFMGVMSLIILGKYGVRLNEFK